MAPAPSDRTKYLKDWIARKVEDEDEKGLLEIMTYLNSRPAPAPVTNTAAF
jgi:hypothetical protein